MEQQYQSSSEYLQAVINSLDDELIIIGQDFRITKVNAAVVKRHGGKRARVIGQYCYEVSHGTHEPCQPPSCECPVTRVWETGKPVRVTHTHRYDIGGESQEKYVDITASPLRDSQGNITEVVELIRDVTEAKRLTRQMREAHQNLLASRQELVRWNIDLENKIQQRIKELSALNAVVTTVSQSLNLDKILNDALLKILAVMEVEAGVVHLVDEKTDQLIIMVQRGLLPEYVREIMKLKPGAGIAGRVVQSGEPIVVNDAMDNPKSTTMVGKRGGFRAYISLPVKSKNKVLGTLSLASYTPNKFGLEPVRLLSAMGDAIGIGVENARAAKKLEEANKIREQLLKKLISAQEEERRRIARELHDEASQSLAALALNLGAIADTLPVSYHDTRQKLDILKEQAIQTLGGIRNLALELRPIALDELGLPMAIDWYVKDYLVKRGLDVKIEVINPKTKLPSYTETMLFRIIQEALTNIVKHAEATQVRVQLQLSDSMAIVQVEDNGKGFDVEAALSEEGVRRNLGLHGMAERATLLGGTFTIKSQPGQGTCVHVEVPLVEEDISK